MHNVDLANDPKGEVQGQKAKFLKISHFAYHFYFRNVNRMRFYQFVGFSVSAIQFHVYTGEQSNPEWFIINPAQKVTKCEVERL